MPHTPTPWVIGVSIDLRGWPCYRLRDMVDPTDKREIEANRKIMEAAPETAHQRDELLKACKQLMNVLGQWPWVSDDCQPINPPGDWRDVREPAWQMGKAAIAAAEPESVQQPPVG